MEDKDVQDIGCNERPIREWGGTEQKLEPQFSGCTNTLTSVQKDNLILEIDEIRETRRHVVLKAQRNEYAKKIRKAYENHEIQERRCNMKEYVPRNDGVCNTITTVQKDNLILEISDDQECNDKAGHESRSD